MEFSWLLQFTDSAQIIIGNHRFILYYHSYFNMTLLQSNGHVHESHERKFEESEIVLNCDFLGKHTIVM